MKRIPKLWTGLGVAAIAGSMAAQADVISLQKGASQSPVILAQEGGEVGLETLGLGAGGDPATAQRVHHFGDLFFADLGQGERQKGQGRFGHGIKVW